jgi:tetratricopeptide (TPR) repeat protein
MEATRMFENRYGWLLRRLANTILFVVLILAATSARASDDLPHRLLESGRREFAAGNYKHAEFYLRRSVTEAGNGGATDTELVLCLGDLSNVLLIQGKIDESEVFLDRAIAILKSRPTVDRRQLPILLGLLGTLYQQTGRLEQTEAVLNEALHLGKNLLTDEPLYLSDIHNDLGVLHLRTGKRKEAESDFKTALALVGKVENLEMESSDRRSSILANLSAVYFIQEKWSLAEQTLLYSIEIVERTHGSEHPIVCTLLDNLGLFYFKQDDLVRSETVLRRELTIRRTVFGLENASTALAASTLANVLVARNKYEEAGILFAEALKTQEQVLGRVPEVATTLDQFANLLRRTHRDDLAGDMASRAESIRFESAYTVSVKARRDR